jgi:hypothetical protein
MTVALTGGTSVGAVLSDDVSQAEEEEFAAPDTARATETENAAETSAPDTSFAAEAEKIVEISINDEGVVVSDYVPPENGRSEDVTTVKFLNSSKEIRVGRSRGEGKARFKTDLDLTFERVNSWIWMLKGDYRSRLKWSPSVDMKAGYSFGRHKWEYSAGIEQPLTPGGFLSAGARMYRNTRTYDDILPDDENMFYAICVKRDYRDYFLLDGYSTFAKASAFRNTVTCEYREDSYTNLVKVTDWSLFRRKTSFRQNWEIGDSTFTIGEGTMKSVVISWEAKSQKNLDEDRKSPGYWYRIEWENAGDRCGGDFSFERYFADLRTYFRLSPSQSFLVRAEIGGNPRGSLPVQKQFFVGGLGSLRAHQEKEYRGNEMLLFNIEYGIDVSEFLALFFVDTGKAWMGRNDFGDQKLALDAGIGLLRDHTGIYFAKNLREENSDVVISFRFNRTF